ncbi:hypothetical protein TrispH2_002228 [Trichoplax sp. H2]|nr:hypothetical protein TrispH2_002228 [Trichoplax sp. H2]|eukprot:RDD45819.1 hypothetical protein TrispH2_002228 [Trichoplax sp. H2]
MNVYNEHTGMQQPNYLSFSGGMEAFNLQGGFGEAYCPTDMSPPMLFNPHYVPGYVTTSVGPCFPTPPPYQPSMVGFQANTNVPQSPVPFAHQDLGSCRERKSVRCRSQGRARRSDVL